MPWLVALFLQLPSQLVDAILTAHPSEGVRLHPLLRTRVTALHQPAHSRTIAPFSGQLISKHKQSLFAMGCNVVLESGIRTWNSLCERMGGGHYSITVVQK